MHPRYQGEHYRVDFEEARRLVRLARTHVPFETIAAMQHATDELRRLLVGYGDWRLLLDLRDGPPGRNDRAFEDAGIEWRRQLFTAFHEVAVLVRTAAGKLQVQRLGRQEGRGGVRVFLDEREALRALGL